MKEEIGNVDMSKPGNQTFGLGAAIPVSAKEVLIYVNLQLGSCDSQVIEDIKIFTHDGNYEYAKYISLRSYTQIAWNTNSENMWFPITMNKIIQVYWPTAVTGHASFTLSVIGYR